MVSTRVRHVFALPRTGAVVTTANCLPLVSGCGA